MKSRKISTIYPPRGLSESSSMFNSWKKIVWIKCFKCVHKYTLPYVGNNLKNASSEKITFFHCSRDQFCRFLLHCKRIEILFCERSGFLIASLPWNPALCRSLTVFEETGFSRLPLRFAGNFRSCILPNNPR